MLGLDNNNCSMIMVYYHWSLCYIIHVRITVDSIMILVGDKEKTKKLFALVNTQTHKNITDGITSVFVSYKYLCI